MVQLNGQWEFYWNRLITPSPGAPETGLWEEPTYIPVPDSWNGQVVEGRKIKGTGAATYRLRIRLARPDRTYSIYLQEAGSAYTLFVDGVELIRVGRVGKSKAASEPRYKPALVTFRPAKEEIELTLQVSNFRQKMGGLWEALRFGPEELMAEHKRGKVALNHFLFGAIFIMGLYHLGLFALRRKDLGVLYFSAFCLLVSLRVMVTGERHFLDLFPALPWFLIIKLEFLTFYLGGAVLAGFIRQLFPDELKRPVFFLIEALCLASAGVVILFPAMVFTTAAPITRLGGLLILIYILGALVLSVRRKRLGAVTLLLGFLAFFAAVINDLLHAAEMIDTFYLFHFGMLGFMLAQSQVLTQKYASAFNLVEQQRHDLERNNRALSESKKKFRNLAELLPGAVFEADGEGRINFANKAAVELFGLSDPAQAGNFHLADAVGKSSLSEFESKLVELRERGKRVDLELQGLKADGSEFPVIVVLNPILDEMNRMEGIRGVALDITQRKELEARLRQAEKMEAIGTLAGGIAHDFNNILAAIIGYTELLLQDTPPRTSRRSYLESILKAGIRAKDLVKQILDYSRRSDSRLKPVNLNPVVQESIRLLKAVIPSTVEIKARIRPETCIVRADPTQIQQLILNLVKNGADEMRESGGVLTVVLENRPGPETPSGRPLPESVSKGYLCLVVGDTGPGIPAEHLDKIFDPFFTTKEVGSGTGLGLSVVHGIVERHGGFLKVLSEPDRGTTFTVWLPAFEGDYREDDFLEDLPPAKGSGRILFVDDEIILVTFHEQMLRKLGYDVTAVDSSPEALEIFNRDPYAFDLIITDYAMPKMNGTDLAAELLKRRPDVPIVLCTGYRDRIDDAGARAMGLAGLILKPVSITELSRMIKEVLS